MFTRRVIMNFKPGSAAEIGRIFESEVLPPLRRQRGMRHGDSFISRELSEAVLNSYWDSQEHADSYGRAAHHAALLALAGVLEGAPIVETFHLSSSTFHHLTHGDGRARRTSTSAGGKWSPAPAARRPEPGGENTATVNCRINERRFGAVTVLDLDGELRTGGSLNILRDAVGRLSEEGRGQILLNLAGLSAIDASGLGELLQSGVGLNEGGGQLKLLRPARALREMMEMTKLLSVFDIFESEAEAVAAFARPLLDPAGRLLSYEHARYEKHS